MQLNRYARFTWFVLAYNVLVVLWGAFVRATGSGAGCGAHWPVCNGVVIPREPALETMIEFSHRLSSGLAFILVLILIIWAFRSYAKGDKIRSAASWAMFFMITESLVGASLVLFRWVAADDSVPRVFVMGLHLINTFLLLAFIALTGYYASGGNRVRFRGQGSAGTLAVLALIAMLIMSVSGGMIALGDTLVLSEGVSPEESPVAAFLISIRLMHPTIAILVSVFLIIVSRYFAAARPSRYTSRAAQMILIFALVELGVGLVNVVLQAPVWIQIVHLLIASSLWLATVLMVYFALDENAEKVDAVKWSQILTLG